MKLFFEKYISENWKSGLTVALVSIPIAISLAVASNATPTAGIITAIWAGFFAAFFGGSHYNVVGPTGALSGILAAYALAHGVSTLSMIAILAGLIILVAYFFNIEKYILLIPGSAIQGFTLGVAGIIILAQLNSALGISGLPIHDTLLGNIKETLQNLNLMALPTTGIFILFLSLLFLITIFLPVIPAIILLTPPALWLGYATTSGIFSFKLCTLAEKFGSISSALFEKPILSIHYSMLFPALAIAIIAILETLISAKIADGMTKTKYDKRKELMGLALANIVSGFCGGIPATAALARTSLNVKTGATHRTSAIISSCCILLISLCILPFFNYLPLAVVAAMLTFTAIRMVEHEHLCRLYQVDRYHFFIAIAVSIITIIEDPIVGILSGTTFTLLLFIEKISRGQCELLSATADEDAEIIEPKRLKFTQETLIYSIKGQLVYINAQAHIARFESDLAPIKNVILYLHGLYFIDPDGIDALDEIIELLEKKGIQVHICEFNKSIFTQLQESKKIAKLIEQKRVHKKLKEALAELKKSNS